MHRTTKLMFCAMALAGEALGQNEYAPPPVGTMVTWSFGSETDRETRLSEVVATGSDFAIFLSDLRLSADTAASYIVEFSGIHVASCSANMPSETERLRLSNAWPLKSGERVKIDKSPTASYTIGKLTSHTLNSIEGPTQARLIDAEFGPVKNSITLSLDWNMAVAVSWPDGSGDTALEIVPPATERLQRGDLSSVIAAEKK